MLSSESSAFSTVGAEHVRDIRPGEIVKISKDGIEVNIKLYSITMHLSCLFPVLFVD